MKKLFIVIPAALLLLSACSGKPQEHDPNNGTHQHDDGSLHQNHEAEKAKQEEFSISADTLAKQTESQKEHKHDGHEHPHQH